MDIGRVALVIMQHERPANVSSNWEATLLPPAGSQAVPSSLCILMCFLMSLAWNDAKSQGLHLWAANVRQRCSHLLGGKQYLLLGDATALMLGTKQYHGSNAQHGRGQSVSAQWTEGFVREVLHPYHQLSGWMERFWCSKEQFPVKLYGSLEDPIQASSIKLSNYAS